MKNICLGKMFKKCTYIFLWMCIGVGIVLHVTPYLFHRSLWIDEALLVSSICTRSFSELFASPLDWGQSAPIGWLLIVKVLTVIGGTSETILRIWSLVTALACICFIYLLLKDKVATHYTLFFTAVFALSDRYIYYANEAKPYMSDNFCCLVVLFIWQKYQEKKLPLVQMVLFYAVLIWFSFPAVFFVAACMIIVCFQFFRNLIKQKGRNNLKNNLWNLGRCAIVLVSFFLNYIFWLSKTSDNVASVDYWNLLRFPLIPMSLSDIKLIVIMGRQFLAFYPVYIAALFCFLFLIYVAAVLSNRCDKSNIVVPFLVSLILLFIASYCGFYPIQDRLVQVYAIMLLVISAYACNEIEISYISIYAAVAEKRQPWILIFYYGILIGCLTIVGMHGCKNLFAQHVYKAGSEVTSNMEYLRENLTDSDAVYVFCNSIPVYTYEIGYETDYCELKDLPLDPQKYTQILPGLPYQKGKTIYGQELNTFFYQIPYSYEDKINQTAIEEDTAMILENDSVYIFTSHGSRGILELLEALKEYGTVNVVNESYYTYLYYFQREKS